MLVEFLPSLLIVKTSIFKEREKRHNMCIWFLVIKERGPRQTKSHRKYPRNPKFLPSPMRGACTGRTYPRGCERDAVVSRTYHYHLFFLHFQFFFHSCRATNIYTDLLSGRTALDPFSLCNPRLELFSLTLLASCSCFG